MLVMPCGGWLYQVRGPAMANNQQPWWSIIKQHVS